MADPRFFRASGPFKVGELVDIAKARLDGRGNADLVVTDVAPLDVAGPGEVSFVDNPRYVDQYKQSRAGACVVSPDRAAMAPDSMTLLVSESPYLAYARLAQAFYPHVDLDREDTDEDALIHPTAEIGEGCRFAVGAVIKQGAKIGGNVTIGPNAVIGPGVIVGDDCHIGPLSSVYYCIMGEGVRLYAGARIGEAGFGFVHDGTGFLTVPQLGRVLIGDNVQIGANSTIDRGSGPDTVIGDDCRIDNLVQIGHNVRLGRNCILVSQSGIAGSAVLEDGVSLGGQSGIGGHLTVGKGAQIGAQAGVMRDVPAGARLIGSPAIPGREFMRQVSVLGRLAREKGVKDG